MNELNHFHPYRRLKKIRGYLYLFLAVFLIADAGGAVDGVSPWMIEALLRWYSTYLPHVRPKHESFVCHSISPLSRRCSRVPGLYSQFGVGLSEADVERAVYPSNTMIGWPLEGGRISSGFGWRKRPLGRGTQFHAAVDIAAPWGTPIMAVAAGVVTSVSFQRGGCGRMIVIHHDETPYLRDTTSKYCHLQRRVPVRQGDYVNKGDVIGWIGRTGRTTGPHLHYALLQNGHPVDPLNYTADDPRDAI